MGVNLDRFIETFESINKIGYASDGGVTRLAFSDDDMKARDSVKSFCIKKGYEVTEDGAGNIWITKVGKNRAEKSVIMGSHIDTVPSGGKYDGVLGVVAGIEVLDLIADKKTEHDEDISVVIFAGEESSRFNLATVGSKLATKSIAVSKLKQYSDDSGVTLYEELNNRGYDLKNLNESYNRLKKSKAFFELHIEQGPVLERTKASIGIVEAIAAPTRLKVEMIGEEAHSGATPMKMRKDALIAAAEVIVEVEKIGLWESKHKTVATVGKCDVFPNALNVVPGNVELYIDIRGIEVESIKRAEDLIINNIKGICRQRKIKSDITILSRDLPVKIDKELIYIIKTNCESQGLKYKIMPSGAGHDAMNVAKIGRAALIFIPCAKGISHNKKETVKVTDVKNGIEILYRSVLSVIK